jgi:diacylglycerol kinase family enzyme
VTAPLLLVNPRSGSRGADPETLAAAARSRGIEARLLARGDDAYALALEADASTLGVAGGDGSLAPVATAAVERDLPFVCIPAGTRNHFARDVGLDRRDPIAGLAAFEGSEHRVDVGWAGGRLFLNNLALGVYARLVHRRETHRRRRDALARLRALAILARHPYPLRLSIDGEPFTARILVIANNRYDLQLLSLGERPRLDEGLLHLYAAGGVMPTTWDERTATRFRLDTARPVVRAAVDGEAARLVTPIELRIEPRALRVLVPPDAG